MTLTLQELQRREREDLLRPVVRWTASRKYRLCCAILRDRIVTGEEACSTHGLTVNELVEMLSRFRAGIRGLRATRKVRREIAA